MSMCNRNVTISEMAESDALTEITTPDHLRSDVWKVFRFSSTNRNLKKNKKKKTGPQ